MEPGGATEGQALAWRRWSDVGTRDHPNASGLPYFVTFTTYERSPVFHDAEAGQLFLAELRKLRIELGFLLLGYVVMPEHVHLVIVPSSGAGLSKVIQHVKGRFSWLYSRKNGAHGKLWQSRYYETVVRDEASLLRRIQYVEGDPVRAGIVSRPEEYPFSSAAGGRDDLDRYLSPGAAAEVWPG